MIWIGIIWVVLALGGTCGETLGWWYCWHKQANSREPGPGNWTKALVFLTGISDYGAESLTPEQLNFLEELEQRLGVDRMVAEPFPYDGVTARQWAKFDAWRSLGFKEAPFWVMSLHNFWQTLLTIVLEKQYGRAVARCISHRIGQPRSANSTLIFICGSAGASLALAAAPILKEGWQVRLIIISYGGVFRASPGLNSVEHFCHLIGTKDGWAKWPELIFPGRLGKWGSLKKAQQEHRFTQHWTGGHGHLSYLSDRLAPESPEPLSPKTYQALTLDVITELQVWQDNGVEVRYKGW